MKRAKVYNLDFYFYVSRGCSQEMRGCLQEIEQNW